SPTGKTPASICAIRRAASRIDWLGLAILTSLVIASLTCMAFFLVKDRSTVDHLEAAARWGDQGVRVNAIWDLALIGNRGVEPSRIFEIIMGSVREDNENIRYWATEGLAYLATDAAIAPLLEIFHDDPSPRIRERAACGLAQSGMFTAG